MLAFTLILHDFFVMLMLVLDGPWTFVDMHAFEMDEERNDDGSDKAKNGAIYLNHSVEVYSW